MNKTKFNTVGIVSVVLIVISGIVALYVYRKNN